MVEAADETSPMMGNKDPEEKKDEDKDKDKSSCCNCSPLVWAVIGFFVVLLFIGLCFWKLSSDDAEKREHAPNEEEKRNSEENNVNG